MLLIIGTVLVGPAATHNMFLFYGRRLKHRDPLQRR